MDARKRYLSPKKPVKQWDKSITTSASHAAPVVGSVDRYDLRK